VGSASRQAAGRRLTFALACTLDQIRIISICNALKHEARFFFSQISK